MHKLPIILVSIAFLITLAACGGRQRTETEAYPVNGLTTGASVGTASELPATPLTLRILAPNTYYSAIRDAERRMSRALGDVEFSIELTSYELANVAEQHIRLQTMMMAGQGYDLFFWNHHPLRAYAANGFLADFYTLMDNHPTTNREDFFTNVLQAYEYNGGLYAFPLTFGFEYVGINAALPESIISRFTSRDSITIQEMLEIYNDLRSQYVEEFGWLQFNSGHSMSLGMAYEVAAMRIIDFIDFDNRVAHLNNAQFAGFLNEFYQAFSGQQLFDVMLRLFNSPSGTIVSDISRNNTFMSVNSHAAPMLALFPHEDPYFLNFIPLASDDGRLIINPQMIYGGHGMMFGTTWAKLAAPAFGNEHLAWEFIQHLIPAMLNHVAPNPGLPGFQSFGHNSLVTPITRRDFIPHATRVLNNASRMDIVPLVGLTDGGSRAQAIDNAIAVLAELNEKPVVVTEGFNLPSSILVDTLTSFLLGATTAEATAQEIHNRISLWLIE